MFLLFDLAWQYGLYTSSDISSRNDTPELLGLRLWHVDLPCPQLLGIGISGNCIIISYRLVFDYANALGFATHRHNHDDEVLTRVGTKLWGELGRFREGSSMNCGNPSRLLGLTTMNDQ